MKKGLSAKGWLVSFIAILILILAVWAAFNVYTDPFGAFGTENELTWWSYSETLNPRVAKISYLDLHHDEYDSYILGSSSCSSWSVDELNEYLDAKFYNLINYGMDATEMQQLAEYIIEHYEVKNLFVSLYIGSADTSGEYEQTLSYSNHYKVNHSSSLAFYAKYLFANPANGIKKIQTLKSDSAIPAAYDCFNEETGAYDKRFRDIEPIGDTESYVSKEAYSVFAAYPSGTVELPYIDEIADAVSSIKALCEEKGINLIVVSAPVYKDNLAQYKAEDVAYFEEAVSSAAGSLYHSYLCCDGTDDCRFFYDSTHFRNALGSACLKNLFEGTEISVGEEVSVPVLMYHSVEENGNAYSISPETFDSHLAALQEAGYTAISLEELEAYVSGEGSLPEKPIVITFDDGYENNYTEAYPLLQKYNAKAAIFVIGKSVGKSIYTDGQSMTPHFSLEQAEEMTASGLITIGCHTYDMHQVEGRDSEPVRNGVLPLEGESEADYASALSEDLQMFEEAVGSVSALSYPEGLYSDLSDLVFENSGISISFTSEVKVNTVIKGLPQSLYHLGRLDADTLSAQQLIGFLLNN